MCVCVCVCVCIYIFRGCRVTFLYRPVYRGSVTEP